MGEKRTFLPYSRGIDQTRLRIGHLAIDVYNPATGLETEWKGFQESISQEEYEKLIKKYTGEPQSDNPCELNFGATKEWCLRIGVPNLVHVNIGPKESLRAVIEGKEGRRFEIREPIAFSNDIVIKQDGVQEWVRNNLSIQAKGILQKGKSAWKPPKIWVCTGIQLIKQGKVKFHTSKTNSYGAGFDVDPGLIAAGVPTGQSVAEIHVGISSTNHGSSNYHHADERVWAAQWFQLDVSFRRRVPGDDEKQMVVKLKPAEDLEHGFRKFESGSSESSSAAVDAELIEVAEIIGLRAPQDAGVTDQDKDSNTQDSQGTDKPPEFDERPYAEAMEGIDWEKYRKYDTYLGAFEG